MAKAGIRRTANVQRQADRAQCRVQMSTTIIWGNFVCNILCEIFVFKYIHCLWQPTIIKPMKCILYTNICSFNFRGSPSP